FGARTGGANANQFIDNLGITTYLQPEVGIAQQVQPQTVLAGRDATFKVAINNPDGATIQWFKNGSAISGETTDTLVLPAVTTADNGSKYKVTITGPNNTVTSDEVTLSVVDIPLPSSAKYSYTFDDGTQPAGTLIAGTTYIASNSGVGDSGSLHLTDAIDSQGGYFIVEDADAGSPVYGFNAHFNILVGGGTVPPADGFSFNFATNIVDDPGALNVEDGVGNGLTVGFDIYDNGNETPPAPSIDVRVNGEVIASKQVPYTFIETGSEYGDVIIRMQNDGTLDVVYNGIVIFDNLATPFSSISGGRFAFAARTGGSYDNFWLDNIDISTDLTSGAVRITADPLEQIVAVGDSANFSVEVNDTTGVTYQWLKNGTAISGATSSSFNIASAALGDSGAKYSVTVTKGGTSITSAEANLRVVDLNTPTVGYTFDNGEVPTGTTLSTNVTQDPSFPTAGYITTSGGVDDSGVLHLTDAVNGQAAAFVIQPLLGGAEVSSFAAKFDLLLRSSGTPADGFSFNFAPDLPNTPSGQVEDGLGSGISIDFDIYLNAGENPPAPDIDVKYKGAYVGSVQMPVSEILTGDEFKQVLINVTQDGKLDLVFGGKVLFSGLQLPNYTFIANGKIGFYARTGGLNADQWVDNVYIQLTKSTAPLSITQNPADALLLSGQTATFDVGVSDPNGATYQWFKNGTAISGATSSSFTSSALTAADNGTKYKVTVTGPGGNATSTEAVVTVVDPLTITNPKVTYDFTDEGVIPEGTTINVSAEDGRLPESLVTGGSLHLSEALGSETATFVMPDFDSGAAVSGITVHMKVHVANGSGTPADGFSFSWANDITPETIFREGGSGTGLTVTFDTYRNAPEEAPAIQISWGGSVVTRKPVPYSWIATGEGFADLYVQVDPDGTLDLQYNGRAIFHNLQLPGYAPISGGMFALGAGTGGEWEEHWFDDIQIATSTGAAPTPVTASIVNGKIHIEWTGGGTLQSSPTLGPDAVWTDVTGATSGYEAATTGEQLFFRVKQ
ncbi:MAG: hypothetical protein ACTHMT_05655, partial [Verrucomicrobiota bacterium]